jgi:hypothetical protein
MALDSSRNGGVKRLQQGMRRANGRYRPVNRGEDFAKKALTPSA